MKKAISDQTTSIDTLDVNSEHFPVFLRFIENTVLDEKEIELRSSVLHSLLFVFRNRQICNKQLCVCPCCTLCSNHMPLFEKTSFWLTNDKIEKLDDFKPKKFDNFHGYIIRVIDDMFTTNGWKVVKTDNSFIFTPPQ
jgi:hypothetical protein